jgi:signal peptidase I
MAILITLFVFQSYEVYGESMETTLQNGDRLIVQKFSKNWAEVFGNEYVPKRHEIVVFDRPPFISSSGSNVDHLIKRVIGLPGERVIVESGKITVFNRDNPNGFDPDEGQEYAKDIPTTSGNVDITLGDRELFVAGDNRGNSKDSRSFGAISTDAITGVATLRFVPVNEFKNI